MDTIEPTPQPLPNITPSAPPKPSPRPRRPRESKVANLPEAVREFVNQSIHNHVPYKKIIAALAEKGHPGFNLNNLSRWSKTGHQQWLLQRERIECLRFKVEDAAQHIRKLEASGITQCARLNSLLVTVQMTQALRDFNPEALTQRLNQDPTEFFRIARTTHSQSLERLRQERLQMLRKDIDDAAEAQRESVRRDFNLPENWTWPSITPSPNS